MKDVHDPAARWAWLRRYPWALVATWTVVAVSSLVGDTLWQRTPGPSSTRILFFGLLWIVGLGGIAVGWRDLKRRTRERDEAGEEQWQQSMVQARRRTEQMVMVHAIGQVITSNLGRSQVVETILEGIQRLLGVEACSLLLYDPDQEGLVFEAVSGVGADEVLGTRLETGQGVAGWVALSGQSALVPDTSQDERFYPGVDAQTGLATRSLVAAPIKVRGEIVGVIEALSVSQHQFDQQDLELLQMLSDTAAIAIDNAQLYEEVRQHTNRLEELVAARTEALRETKDRAEAILNGAGDPIVLTDVSGRVLAANPAFEEQTGYSAAKVTGLHIRRVFDIEPEQGRSARDILAEIQEATLTGERWRGELVVRRKGGTTYEADVIAGARYDQLGQVTGFVSSIRDISKLKEVDRLKDQFVSDVSHELRTPLANLKLYLHLLEQGQPRQRRYYLDTLLREQMRLEHLIENLLDLSQLDLGAVQANRAPLNVGPLVQSLVLDREAAAEAQGLELTTQLAVEPLFVLADGRMLVQVLDNLITNALQYTPALGRVTVRTARCPGDEHDWITISVSDTGLGISSDEQDQIFERFYRGAAARQSGAQGAGLGLAICREIAERHLGRIEVESEPDVGSTFTVYLPSISDLDLPAALETPSWDRAATVVFPAAAPTLEGPSMELQPPQAVGPRVLVVEDEVHLLLGLREALTDAGYQVWTARDGLEGLERLEKVQPDIIISDVMMPRMDGFEFCQTVRARPEGVAIPFIFLTAKGQREARRQGLELGAEDYVIKPFELDDLLHLVDVRLQRSVELWALQQTEMADLKRNISTMLGHELRTPLTYITTYTSLLGEDGTDLDDAQFRRVLQGIQHGSERLGRLVLDFLRLVDLETGVAASNYNLNRVVLDDPGDFIIQVVEKYRSQAQAAGLILRVSLAPAGPLPAIVADTTYLSDALGRLLDNAIKFSSPRGKQVTIRAEVTDQELQVAVSDEGIGIPSDQLEQIFTPFYQVGREQREQSGIGAGLAIVKGIVDLHGGRVEVESQVNVGSTFTIYLPLLIAPFDSDYSHNSGNSF